MADHARPSTQPLGALPSPTSIRLLKLTDARIIEDETSVEYNISCFELDEVPEFVALSYTWGDPMERDALSADGSVPDGATEAAGPATCGSPDTSGSNRIGKNLVEGFVQLWHTDFRDDWIWADAVCIDQENDAEKAVQVGMMDEIYSRAKTVVVWLGADDTDMHEFFWIHGCFYDALLRLIDEKGLEATCGKSFQDPAFISELGVELPAGNWWHLWQSYDNFFRRRRWFSRGWIVQEFVLARDVIVFCGPWAVSWDRMSTIAQWLVYSGWQKWSAAMVEDSDRSLGDDMIRLESVKEWISLAMPDAEGLSQPARPDGVSMADASARVAPEQTVARLKWFTAFLRLLNRTRINSVSDARDSIYSLTGLLKRFLPSGMDLPFRPDYSETMTPQSLFTSITTLFLEELPNFEVLSSVEDRSRREIEDLPSWVPDYTTAKLEFPLINVHKALVDSDNTSTWSSAGLQSVPRVCRVADRRLFVEAAELDCIVATAPLMWNDPRSWPVKDCLTLCEELNPGYMQTHLGPGEVLWRTIKADGLHAQPAPASTAAGFKGYLATVLAMQLNSQWLESRYDTDRTDPYLDDVVASQSLGILDRLRAKDRENTAEDLRSIPSINEVIQEARELDEDVLPSWISRNSANDEWTVALDLGEHWTRILEEKASSFEDPISDPMPYRSLYRTGKGYLGLGHESVEIGDRVYSFKGGKVPFVLRDTTGGEFELIGETYLHGCMHGEMGRGFGDSFREITIV